jgi:transposase
MKITTIGIDLAKSVFSVHGVDEHGKTVLKRQVRREQLLDLMARFEPCLIGMEACSGAHHFARELGKLGHDARIMAPQFVAPYRKSQKNDGNDAEAICEAVGRPNMRFVATKSEEQQALLVVHRVRKGLVDERTGLINSLRGMLCEFGVVLPQGRYQLRARLPAVLLDENERLPALAREIFRELAQRIAELDERILAYDRRIEALVRQSEAAKRLLQIPGVGPITASALVASVGDAKMFDNGRQFAAWLGLVPKQYSTGGKTRLGRISKRGDVYLRTLLIHGTRAVLCAAKSPTRSSSPTALSLWAQQLRARRGLKKTAVALAAKNARIAWALLARGEHYRARPATVIAEA